MLTIHVWADIPQAGLWCPKCLRPSGIQVQLYRVSLAGVSVWPPACWCHDCGIWLL